MTVATKLKTVEQVLDELDEDEAWRPALIAFYERDELRQKALNLKNGAPFDYLDRRAIRALEAALATVREAA